MASIQKSFGLAGNGSVHFGDVSQTFTGLAGVQITGTWTGTLAFEGTWMGHGGTAYPGSATYVGILSTPTNSDTRTLTTTSNGVFFVELSGARDFRIRESTGSGTGTAIVDFNPVKG
jgi:hypothetical protein